MISEIIIPPKKLSIKAIYDTKEGLK